MCCCCCGIDYRVMGEPNPPRLIQPLTCSPFIQFGQTSAAAISLDSASYSSINTILFPPASLLGTGSAVSLLYLCELRPFGLSIIITKYPWIVSCPRLLSIYFRINCLIQSVCPKKDRICAKMSVPTCKVTQNLLTIHIYCLFYHHHLADCAFVDTSNVLDWN